MLSQKPFAPHLLSLCGSYTLKHMSFNDLLINDKKFWVVFISNFLDIICSVILFFTDIFSYYRSTCRNLLTVWSSDMLFRSITRSVPLWKHKSETPWNHRQFTSFFSILLPEKADIELQLKEEITPRELRQFVSFLILYTFYGQSNIIEISIFISPPYAPTCRIEKNVIRKNWRDLDNSCGRMFGKQHF